MKNRAQVARSPRYRKNISGKSRILPATRLCKQKYSGATWWLKISISAPCATSKIDDGGLYSKADDWAVHIAVDGKLVTGQNPASSNAVAQKPGRNPGDSARSKRLLIFVEMAFNLGLLATVKLPL